MPDVDQIARIQFFSDVKKDGKLTTHFYDAVYCRSFWKNYDSAILESMEAEFPEDQHWVCPLVGENFEYELLNNPYTFKDGRNFMMVVNNCSMATKVDDEHGVKTYNNTACSANGQ